MKSVYAYQGAEARAQHLKTVSKIVHQLETAPSLGDELHISMSKGTS
jgi:hypothetical protein